MQNEARVGVVEGGGPAHKLVAHQQRPLQHHGSQIGEVCQLIAGGVAGAVSKTCTAPLARITILFQVIILSISYSFYMVTFCTSFSDILFTIMYKID